MDNIKSIGFIGLGMMGVPMVENVIQKTDVKIFVNDVVEAPVKHLCDQYPNRVQSRSNAREIAEVSVCKRAFASWPKRHKLMFGAGRHHFNGARRQARQAGVP